MPSDKVIRLSANLPEVEILAVGKDILAINKPAGLLIAPDRLDRTHENLMGLLHSGIHLQRPWAHQYGLNYLANVHRLEAGTSGVVILARHKAALVNLARQFRDLKVRKTYVALIVGALPSPDVEVDLPLLASPVHPGSFVVDRNRGKSAVTRFTLLEAYKKYSLIKVEPMTDRLHQIRVHLKELGCPLVADPDYGTGFPLLLSQLKRDYRMKPEGERPFMARPALHAEKVELVHPATGLPLVIEAGWPKDFTVSVKYLKKFAG